MTIEKFWNYVDKKFDNECWNWLRGTDKDGYGNAHIYVNNSRYCTRVKAHRLSYEITYGKFDNNLLVLHKCDNPTCVNPNHLFLGTHKDNMQDALSKKRMYIGEHNPCAKLTEEDAKVIRDIYNPKEGYSSRVLAKQFNVEKTTILDIVNNKRWINV